MGGASELRRHSPFELNFQNVGYTGRVLEGVQIAWEVLSTEQIGKHSTRS